MNDFIVTSNSQLVQQSTGNTLKVKTRGRGGGRGSRGSYNKKGTRGRGSSSSSTRFQTSIPYPTPNITNNDLLNNSSNSLCLTQNLSSKQQQKNQGSVILNPAIRLRMNTLNALSSTSMSNINNNNNSCNQNSNL